MDSTLTQAPPEVVEGTSHPKKSPIVPLIRTLKRKSLLILACLGTTSTLAWIVSADDPPTYGGAFQMLVEPVTSEARVAEPAALTRGERGADNFMLDYPTQLELLQSPKVLLPIYETIQQRYPDFTYMDLRNNLFIERTGGKARADRTKILQVSYRHEDPQLVELVLNEVADKYLTYSLEDRRSRIGEGVKFIEDQLPALQQRVNQLQSQMERLQQQYDLIDPASQGSDVFGTLRGIAQRQRDHERELLEQKTRYQTLQRQLGLGPEEAIAASALSQDPRYQQILTSVSQLESQIALESARFSEESPIIQRLRERQSNLMQLLNREAQRILRQTLGNSERNPQSLTFQDSVRIKLIDQLVNTRNEIQVLQTRGQMLQRNRAEAEREATRFPSIARRFNELQRQLNIATRTLDQFQIQRETLRVEAAQDQVPWEIISPPMLPRDTEGNPVPDPVSSRKKLMLGVAAGLVLGVGGALLLEKLQNVFHSPEDVSDLVPGPLLGIIPRYNGTEPLRLGAIPETAEDLDPSALPFLDAFNALYANLCFEYAEGAVRSLVISSPTPGDGKTTTALYLAQAIAGMGRRVLLVDANFRHPQIHSRLNLPNSVGLSDLLRKQQDLEAVLQKSPLLETLFVLTAGAIGPGSHRLLASPQMKQWMATFRTKFDLVIYDTAHLHNVLDTSFVATHADGILLVNAVRQTARAIAATTIQKLKNYHLPILGSVANGVKQGRGEEEWDEEEFAEAVLSPSTSAVEIGAIAAAGSPEAEDSWAEGWFEEETTGDSRLAVEDGTT